METAQTMHYSTLEITTEGHIAHIVLNRPEAMNSMNPAFGPNYRLRCGPLTMPPRQELCDFLYRKAFLSRYGSIRLLNMKEDFKGDPHVARNACAAWLCCFKIALLP